jgi:hypothetical protein
MENAPESQPETKVPGEENKVDIKKIERQSITLLLILALILASFIAAYFMLKPKPYFTYDKFRVYPLKYGQSEMIIYSFPIKFEGANNSIEILTRYHPLDVENISYSVNKSLFDMLKIGFTMDPDYSARAVMAAKEISGMSEGLNVPTVFGVTRENENQEVLIFDCQNSTEDVTIVQMVLGNETKVFNDGNCIIVQAEDYDSMMKAADKVVLEWLKIIVKSKD